jgi:hypothetical protein
MITKKESRRVTQKIEQRLQLYENGQPYRE